MTVSDSLNIDLNKVAEFGDALLEQCSAARERDPIVWSEASRCWLVLRHADIAAALRGEHPLSAVRFRPEMVEPILGKPWQTEIPLIGRFVSTWVTNLDGPSHKRLRLLGAKALSRPVAEGVRPYVRERIAQLLDVVERKREVEFVEEIARELPGRTILRLMGLTEELYPRLRRWATTINSALGSRLPSPDDIRTLEGTIDDMTSVFTDVLAERRANPRPNADFISLLISATDEGHRLSEDEMLGMMQLMVFAGHDTTTNSLSLGIAGLARAPEQWRRLREHPENIANAVQEIARYTAMSTSQNRTALEDFEWHGKSIRKGDPVFLMIASGNRDPRVFARPDALDVTQDTSETLTFGPGLHHCIGIYLAKMQLEEFFGAVTSRFDGAEILDPRLRFLPPVLFRGLDSLHMRFHPAR